jgi:hypothetical protein
VPVPTWLTEVGIIGTWVVGILAICGDRIRAAVFKPKLHLELKSSVGIYTTQTIQTPSPHPIDQLLPPKTTHARYYHLRVTNRAIYPTAQDVNVMLLGVERRDDDFRRSGELYVPLVLGWAGSVYPLNRSIGSKTDAVADLFFVREDVLRFLPVVVPNNFQAEYVGETHLTVTAIARGIDCESNPIRLNIDWDGKWDFGDDEMAEHLVISEIHGDGTAAVQGDGRGR